jgi:hypothetical protein
VGHLAVTMTYDPDIAGRRPRLTEREVPRGARYGEVVFVCQKSRFFISL